VAQAVSGWSARELERAVVDAGGAAAAMRSIEAWAEHAQGRAVAAEPLVAFAKTGAVAPRWHASHDHPERPLAGVRVLDLTRVLAGPAATRLLAGWGAEVLRIDPLDWEEPALEIEMTLGKRCARLDLRSTRGRSQLLELLRSTDVLVHGYRPGALEGLGLGAGILQEARPGLVDVSLSAYGWSGPWWQRRGFDSLVQMSSGIAAAGRALTGEDTPAPLPVQALDHATGYIMAAAALSGLRLRQTEGVGSRWRTSLARTAQLLIGAGVRTPEQQPTTSIAPPTASSEVELTTWGPARRIAPPLLLAGAPLHWSLPARALGTDEPRWSDSFRKAAGR
jgi:crotonobetainyl-CoA:carnitine CoA-transferase CaiB-like acyl-CoA transferase